MLHRQFILTITVLLFSTSLFSAENKLKGHASPYLAMHGEDPTQWQEWNAQTVARAKKENKLLFVSSGYFSCHWCHVMQKESYQNPAIAKLLNENFIPVKVDRELNSPLDAHLIDFVERTQGYSGWPLNVFVTPDGYPLVGMVYVPPDNFKTILEKLQAEWQSRPGELKVMASAASQELSGAQVSSSTTLPAELAGKLQKNYIDQIFSYADTLQGGFGQENKFPSVPQLMALIDVYKRSPDEKVKQFLELTLNEMAAQGLRDQLGGGFYRYVVDPGWQVPHFEKMLYDNALLASLYLMAGDVLNNPSYTHVATETLDFILTDMNTRFPAFAASLSAVDDKGIEGGFYLWNKDELVTLLTQQERKLVNLFWQLEGNPDLDDGHHLVQSMSITQLAGELNIKKEQAQSILASAKKKMLSARAKRVLPKDEKILTAWNGLVLSALVDGVRATGNQKYKKAADSLYMFIAENLWDENKRELQKAHSNKNTLGAGGLEDYAFIANGLYGYWLLTNDKKARALLDDILTQAWARFYGKQGWILAEDMLLKYGGGRTMLTDSPLPSPSATLIRVSVLFGNKTKNKRLMDNALRALNVGHDEVSKDAFWFATQVRAIMTAQTGN